MKVTSLLARVALALISLAVFAVPVVRAAEPTDEKVLVDQASITLRDFMSAKEMGWFRKSIEKANGVMIVPGMYKAGLLIGGSGGKGVFLARDGKTGEWRGPAFYNMGSVNIGLQIGAEKSEIILLAMNKEALDILMSPSFKLGTDASVAAGPVGVGIAGSTAQIPTAAFVAYARSKGAYVGLTLDGAVVKNDEDANEAYYGRKTGPEEINPPAHFLRKIIRNGNRN